MAILGIGMTKAKIQLQFPCNLERVWVERPKWGCGAGVFVVLGTEIDIEVNLSEINRRIQACFNKKTDCDLN